jgi:hypothetical protein
MKAYLVSKYKSVLGTPFALPGGATGKNRLQRIGAGKHPNPAYGTRRALLSALRSNGMSTLRRRRG